MQASRLIVIDIPGHGLAPEMEPEFSYKPELAVGCCFEAIKHFKIPKFSIVGHSLGGMIALLMALKAPSHINDKQKSTAIKVSVLWFD